ncbi:MAG: rhomboid family intramembrane serine protease [Verrucomicrobia bacterium]|nr:rhomboid family intramembrane serine protease [Verrucomicrobiota bacterium]
MLEDRDYMRGPDYGSGFRWRWSLTILLLVVNAAVFLVQAVAESSPDGQRFVSQYLALSLHGLKEGCLWQPLTFQFLHANLFHLLANLITIYFFGGAMEQALGRGKFISLYFACGVLGGLLQILGAWAWPSHFSPEAPAMLQYVGVMGASAGAFGLVAAFAALFPDRVLTLLVFFIIPVSLRARYLLFIELALTLFGIAVPRLGGNIAHLAHLGGIVAGLGYVLWMLRAKRTSRVPRRAPVPRPHYAEVPTRKAPWQMPQKKVIEDLPPAEFISKEVDPILDKISAHGIHSLTPRERRILEAASAKIGKR